MQELNEILNLTRRLSRHMEGFFDPKHGPQKAPAKLLERFSRLPLTPAALDLLNEHASPTLKNEFSRAAAQGVSGATLAVPLVHSCIDPLNKSMFLIALMAHNLAGTDLALADDDSKRLLANGVFSLIQTLKDVSANLDLLLPLNENDASDASDVMRRDIRDHILPHLQQAAPALMSAMGFDRTAALQIESTVNANLMEGREQLARLPAREWREALRP